MALIYSIFLFMSAWFDLRSKKIPAWLLGLFGSLGVLIMVWGRRTGGFPDIAAAFLPGILLLSLSACTRGAAGVGDGCFFIVSACYLGYAETMILFIYGLLFCGTCSLGMVAWGSVHGIRAGKMRLPFLPFIIPAWLWLLFF